MSAALAAAPPMRAPAGPTLADVLQRGVGRRSAAGAHAECPVCSRLAASRAGPPAPASSAAAASDCGTTLE